MYNEQSELVAFGQKLSYRPKKRPNERKEGQHGNEFGVFLNTEMNVTNS